MPVYLGLGASGSSYLPDIFYLNTFDVGEYIRVVEEGQRVRLTDPGAYWLHVVQDLFSIG